jgi:hypothetical protein
VQTAVAFYAGLGALIFGLIRVTTASLERRGRDVVGIVAIAMGIVLFAICVVVFLRSPEKILPI